MEPYFVTVEFHEPFVVPSLISVGPHGDCLDVSPLARLFGKKNEESRDEREIDNLLSSFCEYNSRINYIYSKAYRL